MPGINDNFRSVTGERIITSYDFLDIAKGNAIQRFFAGHVLETSSGTDKYILSDNAFYSSTTNISGFYAGASGWAVMATANFDVQFGIPRQIKGDALATCSYGWVGGSSYSIYMYILLTLQKVSGAVVTDLATAKTTTTTSASSQYMLKTAYFNVPLTNFKLGDKMRLKADLYGTLGGNNATFYLGCDPKNRTVTGIDPATSILDLFIPFKIQL